MASKPAATRGRQVSSSREAQINRRALGQIVLRLQAQYIRSSLAIEIQEFENSFEELLQTASVFLVTTERVARSSSLVVVDHGSVIKTVCHFLASSNAILQFLDFQQQNTGLDSGGDCSLERQVNEAQALVGELLNTFLLYKRAETYPGRECGLIYNEDVKIFSGFLLHKYGHADENDVPDPLDEDVDMGKLVRYWHTEGMFHPLRHVPGTPWHKFFGNIKPGPIMSPELFRERKPQPFFKVLFPKTITWLQPEVMGDYEKYRELFERFRRMPGPRLPEFVRASMTRRIQRRHSHLFRGWKRIDESKILHLEDMSELPCPEYNLLGLSRFEALNAEINATELAGIALLGAEIPPVPVFLEGEPRKYCLEFDGQWDY